MERECPTPCYHVQTHFEEYRGQTDHKYKHQHNCYILTDVPVNFTSKAPTVMVTTLSSVSPNMGYLSSTCFWSHESQHNAYGGPKVQRTSFTFSILEIDFRFLNSIFNSRTRFSILELDSRTRFSILELDFLLDSRNRFALLVLILQTQFSILKRNSRAQPTSLCKSAMTLTLLRPLHVGCMVSISY